MLLKNILLLLVFSTGIARANEMVLPVYGVGNTSCTTYIELYEADSKKLNIYKVWITGYLTSHAAIVAYFGREVENVPARIVIEDLYGECKGQKDGLVIDAVLQLMNNYNTEKTVKIKKNIQYIKQLEDMMNK